MDYIGFCVGSSSISYFDGKEGKNISHNGDPIAVLKKLIPELLNKGRIIVTGRRGRKNLNLPKISEVEATEMAYRNLQKKYGDVDAIVSAGSENFILYTVNSRKIITGIYTGNKCASGTGEFFLQQIKRMDISLETANIINTSDHYELSSRCSVFCKSDCTHALNKGLPKELVLNGLGKVMADKIIELAHKAKSKKILLIGGASKNKLMLRYLKDGLDIIVPEEALYFEALGAREWGKENQPEELNTEIFREIESEFPLLKPLSEFERQVEFKEMNFAKAIKDDECILGVDVGSTTTKAILFRIKDKAILAGIYLRTLGDPVRAARNCYEGIENQLNVRIRITGIGVTGSGRKLVGLHAKTEAVYNEIMAHATAASYFDREVDTVFEIGGQDAKYTYLVNTVPADYAMNEACSAGTGSFLEEAAKEALDIDYTEIGELAMRSKKPPNFSDQCAAFIGSDIKTAVHEGISKEDICAGLVYSICMNYINRVKGNRPVGKKIFVQGGVSYNRAVPVAMAALTGKAVVVPPHPGLIGAYGVALMVIKNIELGLLSPGEFFLDELAAREVNYEKSFICPGGREKCDRKCSVRIINIDGEKYPFGGSCNKYENVVRNLVIDSSEYNYLRRRELKIFDTTENTGQKTVGISKSFAMNSLFPLFYSFFRRLGFKVVLPDESDRSGWERQKAAFCFPLELSHGYLFALLSKDPDYLFVPAIRGLKVENSDNYNVFCPFVQSEPDILKTAFPELDENKLIAPNLDFSRGIELEKDKFEELAVFLGKSPSEGFTAFEEALKHYKKVRRELKAIGKEFLNKVKENEFGLVVFGRSYNAFSSQSNMSIPEKLASRGIPVISLDCLPYEQEEDYKGMYWAWGEMILKAARYIKKTPKLFGVYITNFSCGPDSFLISYFRDIMGIKPSLVLELDSHTADAGIETRIEAFVDVVKSHLVAKNKEDQKTFDKPFTRIKKNRLEIVTIKGEVLSLTDKKVKLVIPSMGEFGSLCLAASFKHYGVETEVCPVADIKEFSLGKGNSLSKECLPLQLTLGNLIRQLEENRNDDKVILFFMPKTMGPCRFGQYSVFMNHWLERNKADNCVLFSLDSENAYAGIGNAFKLRIWISMVLADVFSDVENALLVMAKEKEAAKKAIEEAKKELLKSIETEPIREIFKKLEEVVAKLSHIEKKGTIATVPRVLITGEIYVRKDEFSRKNLEVIMADNGIIAHVSPIHEWVYYTDYLFLKKLTSPDASTADRIKKNLELRIKRFVEKRLKKIFEKSGLYNIHMVDIESVVETASDYLSPKLTGEAIITAGTALHEILKEYDGILSIGPFGCMPSKIAEAVIKRGVDNLKKSANGTFRKVFEELGDVPIAYVEADGNPFTPTIENRIEAFMVQVKRLRRFLNKEQKVQ